MSKMPKALVYCCLIGLWMSLVLGQLSRELVEIVGSHTQSDDSIIRGLFNEIKSAEATIDSTSAYIQNYTDALATDRSHAACRVFEAIFSGRVISKTRTGYTTEQNVNWSSTCWLPAACFIKVNHAIEVAVALRIITSLRSTFSIRGGGHNPNPGFSSTADEGILLDLQGLRTLSMSQDGVLQLGPGNIWKDAYDFVEGHNRTVKGARVQEVGVSGFLLGGGLVYFPSLQGLAVDSIVGYEIVLGNSKIIEVTEQSDLELFLALKGGGPNFGVVTRFDVLTYPTIPAQYSLAVYNVTDYENILNLTLSIQRQMELDPKIDIVISVTRTDIIIESLYADWSPQVPDTLESLSSIPSIVGTIIEPTNGSIGSYEAAKSLAAQPYSSRRLSAHVATTPDYDLYLNNHKMFMNTLQRYPSLLSANISYVIAPLASTAVQAGVNRGGNSLGLKNVAQIWWAFVVEWADAESDTAAQQLSQELLDGCRNLASAQGDFLSFEFMNHASFTQKVLGSYGSDNVARLQSVAKRFDPDAIFQSLQTNGFLLRKL